MRPGRKLIAFLLALFFINSASFSQNLLWKHFDKSNSGLPSNTIRCVTQDKFGIYWIGTWDSGLVKFDKKNGLCTTPKIPNFQTTVSTASHLTRKKIY